MSSMTPNDLPPEIVFKIVSLSLGRSDESDPRVHRWKLKFLRVCCLICRGWLDVCQAFLFQNVYIRRTKTFRLFCRSLSSSRNVGRYVRKLMIALPTWEDTSQYPMSTGIEKCLQLLEGLEELEVKPPFDGFFSEKAFELIHGMVNLKKVSIRKASGLQVANVKAYADRSVDFGADKKLDIFRKLVLPKTVEHLHLVQPSNEFMDGLPSILKEILSTEVGSKEGRVSEPGPGLKSFSLQISGLYNRLPNPNVYDKLPQLLSAKMTSFKLCLDTRLEDQTIIDLLSMTPFLQELTLGRIGLSQFLFRHLAPLTSLQSLSLIAFGPTVEADVNVDWLEFCDAITSFIEKSPLMESFEFDTALSIHTAFISLLLELLYVTTFESTRTYSRLKHLNIKHNEPPPMSSIERICERAPFLESLSIKVPIRALGRLKAALSKLTHLNCLELNNFVMVKKPLETKIDTEPFFLFTERQNHKRNTGDHYTM
ncbi:uncharacterized protein PGTG_08437 [Puccinia graminis f. sp. tritici CRL 75-36-700-3]|uniref:Uncharacterized protein n=1 Tax=Puccinia graminis f. sp. tritici (strain CRL 75-36-700-3 / race SCCL) TaxID=418459 RepID=E3KDP5_PUCGT|nr:uncharacterized protein PGTG_08437 [Puccinia graminis f. sp. tritici CRL 75-36-700-3]EFP82481.2 hypothetical protein PGTG_08437 [Puccinia graminis f. sp. tritici CRL 75-36-700-3]